LAASRMGITVHGTVRLVLHESGHVTLHLGGRSAAVSEAVNRHLPERWYVYKEGSQWCLRETRDDGSTEFIRASGEITFDPTRPIEQISAPLNPRQRRAIPDRIKVFVWQRDGGKCVQCGSTEKLEYDHIIPLSRGGSNSARNIQLLCQDCNRRKGNSIT